MTARLMNGANLGNQRIVSLGDAQVETDAATWGQVKNYVNGLAFKDEVRVATTAAGTLASSFANGQTIDGVVLATGDRILIKNQATQTENGIYVVAASGAPTRAADADNAAKLNQATVRVVAGSVNIGSQWTQGTAGVVIGTSNIVWASSGASGSAPTSGSGAISVSGQAVSFVPKSGGGILQDGTGAYLDTSYVARKFAQNIGNGSLTSIAVTHNFGSRDVDVAVYDTVTYEEVIVDNVRTDANTVTLTFATAPATGAYRVIITG